MDEINPVWYAKGLKFQCTGCGKCCTGAPGYVFLSQTDLDRLADRFSLTPEEFSRKYVRLVDGVPALLDRPRSGDCIFLQNNQCTVYESRPVQCRTFPWWVSNLNAPEDWQEAAERCEGIDHPEAPTIPVEQIQEQCLTYLDNLIEQNFEL